MKTTLLPPNKDPMGQAIADYFNRGKAAKLRVFSSQFDEDEIPVKDGYVFVGWGEEVEKTVSKSKEFVAVYEKDENNNKIADSSENKLTIKYLNKVVSIFDKKVIVAGHSKGGHLAIVSSMYSNFIVRSKIKAIYNFDGPGLREEQIDTKKYRNIENKILHICVGV